MADLQRGSEPGAAGRSATAASCCSGSLSPGHCGAVCACLYGPLSAGNQQLTCDMTSMLEAACSAHPPCHPQIRDSLCDLRLQGIHWLLQNLACRLRASWQSILAVLLNHNTTIGNLAPLSVRFCVQSTLDPCAPLLLMALLISMNASPPGAGHVQRQSGREADPQRAPAGRAEHSIGRCP